MNGSPAPVVSVVMPVLNGGPFLRLAIESVRAQTLPALELLIVDDGSTDGSLDVALSFGDPRIQVIRNERRAGLAAALNVGLRRANGEFVARLDADDVARADRLERQVAFLRQHPRVVLVGSQARRIDESGAAIGTVERCRESAAIRWYHLFDNPFIHSTVMFRRHEVVDELGGYDESLRLCEDWALWARIISHYDASNLGEPLIDYRFSLSSITGAIESSPTHPRRPMFHDIARALIARHVSATLGPDAVSAADVELLTGFLLGVSAETLGRFLAVFGRLQDAFVERYPEARTSEDFHRTVARQYDAIAYRVSPPRRGAALSVYAAALGRGAAVARWLPWPRVAALTLFGKSGRDRIRTFRTSAA